MRKVSGFQPISGQVSESQRVRINGVTLIMQIAHRCVVYSFPVAIVKKKEKKRKGKKEKRKEERTIFRCLDSEECRIKF